MRAYSHRLLASLLAGALAGCGSGDSGLPTTSQEGADGQPNGLPVAIDFLPSAFARTQFGPGALRRYREAGREVGLDWTVVAATDRVEGRDGDPLAIAYTLSSLGASQSYETALRARGGSLRYARRVLRLGDALRGRPRGRPIPRDSAPLLVPLEGPLLSRFGDRFGVLHDGIDIGAAPGRRVRAVAAGIVIYAGPRGALGDSVCLAHRLSPALRGADRLTTCYGHLGAIEVRLGEPVARRCARQGGLQRQLRQPPSSFAGAAGFGDSGSGRGPTALPGELRLTSAAAA